MAPVDTEAFHDYLDFVSTPMDLKTVQTRLNEVGLA